jgi:hypothetical protein
MSFLKLEDRYKFRTLPLVPYGTVGTRYRILLYINKGILLHNLSLDPNGSEFIFGLVDLDYASRSSALDLYFRKQLFPKDWF